MLVSHAIHILLVSSDEHSGSIRVEDGRGSQSSKQIFGTVVDKLALRHYNTHIGSTGPKSYSRKLR
jgi:hypothetical protein